MDGISSSAVISGDFLKIYLDLATLLFSTERECACADFSGNYLQKCLFR